uniref:2OG-Fe(II) oxygenase superfamily protein n=1 Tax=Megaviridae environmental sample TaxID=1737588 RepID=A0A5J6VJ04_9VIRU|nr:MAG: 2OG-Fe(II) oxygenase superfamily protein [Megaviridae environmental sample]
MIHHTADDCYIKYIPEYLSINEHNELIEYLNNTVHVEQQGIPRAQKWFHMNGSYFDPMWKGRFPRWESHTYDDTILTLQEKIQTTVDEMELPTSINKCRINSCLVNKYRGGSDSIRPHKDSLRVFGETPLIIGLSVGDVAREILFERVMWSPDNPESLKLDKNASNLNFSILLEPRSLFLMGGNTQKFYSHQIPKCNVSGTRYSLTFREHLCFI